MRSLTEAQQAVVDASVKKISWLFHVVDSNNVNYYWSTKSVTFDSQAYSFRVIDFNGIKMARPKTEMGIMTPSAMNFKITNKDNAINADDLEDGTVTVTLAAADANTTSDEIEIASWKFIIKKTSSVYQSAEIECEDFLQQYISGNYPIITFALTDNNIVWEAGVEWEAGVAWYAGGSGSSRTDGLKVRDIFPSSDGDIEDNCCIPIIFGTAYIPLRSAYVAGEADRYYILGQTRANDVAITYTISAVRTPREYSTKVEYTSPTYDFTQEELESSDGHKFQGFQAMVAAGPSAAFYPKGDNYYDLPTKFSRDDTSSLVDPGDIIDYVLQDMGISSGDIDLTSFTAASTTYAGWGLEFNGGFWQVLTKEAVLTNLLCQCHSVLISTDKIYLKVLDVTSRKTITSADIIKNNSIGEGSCSISKLERTLADCGNVSYSPTDDSQDIGVNALVPAQRSSGNIDSDVL